MPKQNHPTQSKLQQVGGDETFDWLSQETSEITAGLKSTDKKSIVRYHSQDPHQAEPAEESRTAV